MRRGLHAALGLALLVAVAGCSRTQTVRGQVVYPASVPVRTFPRIWVSTGHLGYEIRIAEAVVRHLRADQQAKVRRVPLDDLEPMRDKGEIPPATVVVLLEAELTEGTRPDWTTRPETVCGPLGCYTRERTYLQDLPTVHGELTVTVYDGPTARVLQRVNVEATEDSRDYMTLRRRVERRLIDRAKSMMDQRRERVEVALLDVELPSVRRAQALIEAGDWHEGRQELERAVRSDAVQELPAEERARVYYDLGVARRFDPTTMKDLGAHFDSAEQALKCAVRLDPADRYARALRELREHRERLAKVRKQREATEHNYRVGRLDAQVPSPPAGYDRHTGAGASDGPDGSGGEDVGAQSPDGQGAGRESAEELPPPPPPPPPPE